MSSNVRNGQLPWSAVYQTAAPAACSTLRNFDGVVQWGYTCTFSDNDSESTLPQNFPINTACAPWMTPGVVPATNAFYSPASVCPDGFSAVATQTAGIDWLEGETGLTCCPSGFQGNNNGGCSPAPGASFPVVICGDADEEENEFATYVGGAFPATATVNVAALQLRYGAPDAAVPGTSASGGLPSNTGVTSSSNTTVGNESTASGGLSVGAKAAIGTVIPLVSIFGALFLFMLWRRRKARKANQAAKWMDAIEFKSGNHLVGHVASTESKVSDSTGPLAGPGASRRAAGAAHEIPEWNVEMDARDTERSLSYRLVPGIDPTDAAGDGTKAASELGGFSKQRRKPLPSYELDGHISAELPGREARIRHELPT